MIKEVIIVLLLVHGIIHLVGFAKGFGVSEIDQFSAQVTRKFGTLWLAASILLLISATFFLLGNSFWIPLVILSLCLSQILIVKYWFDAKTGTIINAFLAIAIVIYFNIQ